MYQLVLIEDEEQTRTYLRTLINSCEKFEVAADFGDAESAIKWFESDAKREISIVLSDIQLPGKSGIELIGWLKQNRPTLLCMMLSAYDDADKVFRALKSGAVGYVLKGSPAAVLVDALQDVMTGGSPMSSQIARKVVNAFMEVPYEDPMATLTQREHEVLGWLAKGFSYKEIADKVFLAVDTVRTHIRNIYAKLHVQNKRDAIRKSGLY